VPPMLQTLYRQCPGGVTLLRASRAASRSLHNPLRADGKGAYGCINPIGGDINLKLAKSVRDDGKLLLFANLGSNLFQVQSLEA